MTDIKNINYNDLPEDEKKKLQKQFHKGDLNYFASFAVEANAIHKDDLIELDNAIDKHVSGNSLKFNSTILIALTFGIFIGFSAFFIWYKTSKSRNSDNESVTIQNPMNPVLTLKPADADSPEPSGIKSEEPAKEHFNISESGEKLNALPEMENMTFKDIYPVDVKSPPFTTTEEMLNYIPNASVIFIHDLKIANYTNYYFKNSENIDIRDNSLSPQFANKEESGSLSKQLQDRDYYAHEIIKDAMEAFNKKQFTVCIDLLDLLHGYNKNDTNAQFYLGMCFYHLGDYNKALKYFTSASDNNINIFLLEAEFYTALCYKNTNKINEANELFKQIINKNLFYAKRAAEELK